MDSGPVRTQEVAQAAEAIRQERGGEKQADVQCSLHVRLASLYARLVYFAGR